MTAARAILMIVGGLFALLIVAGLVWVALPDKPSVVTLQNAGAEPVQLSVTTTNPGSYSWHGTLQPGERVSRRASFSDNSFQVDCRDNKGRSRRGHGYVTNGLSFVVTMSVKGCDDVAYDAHTVP